MPEFRFMGVCGGTNMIALDFCTNNLCTEERHDHLCVKERLHCFLMNQWEKPNVDQ